MTRQQEELDSRVHSALVEFTRTSVRRALILMATLVVVVCGIVLWRTRDVDQRMEKVLGRFDAIEAKVDGVVQTTDSTKAAVDETQETINQGSDLVVEPLEPDALATAQVSAPPAAVRMTIRPKAAATNAPTADPAPSSSAVVPIPEAPPSAEKKQ